MIPKRLAKILNEIMPTEADEPLVNDEITDANARQAFGKSMTSTLKSLHKSDLYKDALTDNEHLATLLPLVLEKYLSSLLKDAGARETIEKYKLTADEVVAIRWYGREGFQYVQQSLRQKPDPTLGQDNDVAPLETFKNLGEGLRKRLCQAAAAAARHGALPRHELLVR